MKNRIQVLLAAAIASSVAFCAAAGSTNKTHLNLRSEGANLALVKTAGWPALVNREASEDAFGGNVEAVFFMSGSADEGGIARHFLFEREDKKHENETHTVTFGRSAANAAASTTDFDLGYLIHDATNAITDKGATLKFAPEHKSIGVTFNYHQELKCLLKGLYFDVAVPVVNVKNTLGITTDGNEKAELTKFFAGTRAGIAAGTQNAYKNLTKAKVKAGEFSETGVADVDVKLGYQFLDSCNYRLAFDLGVTVPTGNKANGEYAFDAIVGNGNHIGFGFGVDFGAKMWKSEDCEHCLSLDVAAQYRYLFKNDETRTLGLKDKTFGQYTLLIDKSLDSNAQQLQPAANVTTLRVDVTPGSQFDGVVAVNYNWCCFGFDLGYNVFFRETEETKLRSGQWDDAKYAIATRKADMDTGITDFEAPMTDVNYVEKALAAADLDVKAAATPSLTSHKLFGGVSYMTKDWEVPVLVGVGAHYEWANNDLNSNWGFNARLGVGF